MATRKRARPGEGIPEDVKVQEGAALHSWWVRRKKRTQDAFAHECGFTQGYVQQFFKGIRPLRLEHAVRFAEELNIEISDFSQRLAVEFEHDLKATEWPFKGFSREQYMSLTPGQRMDIEDRIRNYIALNGPAEIKRLRRVK